MGGGTHDGTDSKGKPWGEPVMFKLQPHKLYTLKYSQIRHKIDNRRVKAALHDIVSILEVINMTFSEDFKDIKKVKHLLEEVK